MGIKRGVVAAATAYVDVLPAVLVWHHTLEQRLQRDRRAPCLELGISLTQEAAFLLDILAINRVPVDDQRVDPQRHVLDKVLPALPQVFQVQVQLAADPAPELKRAPSKSGA
jgi:hypothetical protein